jgi:hypothetical protein
MAEKPEILQIENAEKRIYSEAEKAAFSEQILNAWCPRTCVSTARATSNERLALFLIQCKSWSCPACGPRKKRELVAKILKAKPKRFLTLTVQAPTAENGITWTPREAFDRTRRSCAKLFREMARETKKKTEYVRVLEQTKAGYPHYHYLTKGPFWPVASISARWQRLTGAYVVDIQKPAATRNTIAYVAKYVAKSTGVEFTKRRVSASRNFFTRCPDCKKATCQCKNDDWYDWRQEKGHFQEVIERYSFRRQLIAGPTPQIWWIEQRTAGDDIPADLAKHFHANARDASDD